MGGQPAAGRGAGGVVWQGEVFAFWEAVRDILRMRLVLERFSMREAKRVLEK